MSILLELHQEGQEVYCAQHRRPDAGVSADLQTASLSIIVFIRKMAYLNSNGHLRIVLLRDYCLE